jgi:hypothetical protein
MDRLMRDLPDRTHNGGPPLDEHVPEWGTAGIGTYFAWKRAHRAAWTPASSGIALLRLKRADACGLTYEEYVAELLDSGRYLQPTDIAIIARIKARRAAR